MKSNRISNVVPFLLVMVFHQDCPLLTVFLFIKTSSQSISLTPTDFAQTLRILRQLFNEHAAVNDFGKRLPVSRNAAARKIGNDVISLLLHLHN